VIIYLITNKTNNKKYVGQTTKSLLFRWGKHVYKAQKGLLNLPLSRAIRKYGENAFVIEKIDESTNPENLNELEIKYIKSLKTLVPNGYNIATGGKKEFSEYHRKRISEGIKNSSKYAAAKELMKGENHPMHKLNMEQIKSIRNRFICDKTSSYSLAKEFGITQPNIMSIINNKTWKDKSWNLDKKIITKAIERHRKDNVLSGENHSMSKLTWETVRKIRQTYLLGTHTTKQLAEKFGTEVKKILNNESWKDKEWEKSKDLVEERKRLNRKLKKPSRLVITKKISEKIRTMRYSNKMTIKKISNLVNISESSTKKFLSGKHPYYPDENNPNNKK